MAAKLLKLDRRLSSRGEDRSYSTGARGQPPRARSAAPPQTSRGPPPSAPSRRARRPSRRRALRRRRAGSGLGARRERFMRLLVAGLLGSRPWPAAVRCGGSLIAARACASRGVACRSPCCSPIASERRCRCRELRKGLPASALMKLRVRTELLPRGEQIASACDTLACRPVKCGLFRRIFRLSS